MTKQTHHIFVCMQDRPPGDPRGGCMGFGGERIAKAFRRELDRRNLSRQVSLTTTVCMGVCGGGANVLIYPEAVVYAGVSEADVAEIVDAHLVGGTPVARLIGASRW